MEKEIKYLSNSTSGMDSDNDAFVVDKDSWVNAENIRTGSTDKGFTGRLESIGGTTQISTPQPSVTFYQIGSAIDEENNRIVYFKYNTTGIAHKIVCYDGNSGTEYDVLL